MILLVHLGATQKLDRDSRLFGHSLRVGTNGVTLDRCELRKAPAHASAVGSGMVRRRGHSLFQTNTLRVIRP